MDIDMDMSYIPNVTWSYLVILVLLSVFFRALFHFSLCLGVINSDVYWSEVSQEGTLVNKESKPHDCR